MLSTKSQEIIKCLNGLFFIYKPPLVTIHYLRDVIKSQLSDELNEYDVRPSKEFMQIDTSEKGDIHVTTRPSYADHINVVGPRYVPDEISLYCASAANTIVSGVCVFGINKGCYKAQLFKKYKAVTVYRIKGVLGIATKTTISNGEVVGKAKYEKLKLSTFQKTLRYIESFHLRKMYMYEGNDLHGEEAYIAALKGPLRPTVNPLPIIYSLKCTDFTPPDFTLEVQCVETPINYLLMLINDIGLKLKTLASTSGIRCLRHGCFTVEDSLLLETLTLQTVINQISYSRELMFKNNINLNVAEQNLKTLNTIEGVVQ